MDLIAYLNQGQIWITPEKEELQISDMAPGHARLCAQWLYDNATGLILVVESAKNEDVLDGNGHVSEVLALVQQSPRKWVTGLALHRALLKVAGHR